ncbi:GNAT family N-acetyltransferase [Falsiroseomonas sp. HW251]|uniref:GNAT family N-acetyltransferase n=1 Tax=Falsiroseomonas sp. HW251 TaxID=3390998 RepID=UPI003D31C122
MPYRLEATTPEAVASDWAALWSRAPDATPFQHPAWLIPWWRHFDEGDLRLLALRDGEHLRALLPLYVHRRGLLPLGIGTSDYLDALAEPGFAEPAMAAFLAHRHDGFDRADWPQLRPASPLLSGKAPPGWRDATEPAEPCPVLALPARFDLLGERVSAKTLRDLRTARRRAAEAGASFEEATAATLTGILDALFHLHAARWATRGEAGVLADPRVEAWHRDAAPALLQAGLLRLFALRLDGRIVGVIHALADPPGRVRRTLYLYLQGFDPALERLSPGLLLVGEAVERGIADGFAAVDFLRGQERYKSFWGAANAPTFRRVLIPPEAACARC